MSKLSSLLGLGSAALLGCSVFSISTHAAEVKVTWEEPESYSDVRPSNETRKRFRDRTFSQLEAHIVELAQSLPESQTLSITVTNVDLAGEVWPSQFVGFGMGGPNDIRVIRRIDIPRITFSYSLSDENEQVIVSEDDVTIKDMNFMESAIRRHRNDPLSYEKNMLDDWFADTFPKQVAVNN